MLRYSSATSCGCGRRASGGPPSAPRSCRRTRSRRPRWSRSCSRSSTTSSRSRSALTPLLSRSEPRVSSRVASRSSREATRASEVSHRAELCIGEQHLASSRESRVDRPRSSNGGASEIGHFLTPAQSLLRSGARSHEALRQHNPSSVSPPLKRVVFWNRVRPRTTRSRCRASASIGARPNGRRSTARCRSRRRRRCGSSSRSTPRRDRRGVCRIRISSLDHERVTVISAARRVRRRARRALHSRAERPPLHARGSRPGRKH